MNKFIGADLHKKSITFCVVDHALAVVGRRKFLCQDVVAMAAWLRGQGQFQIVVEATASYEWFVQLVEPLAQRVLLAHPGKLRVIAESTRKSDKLDARVLAEFLAHGMIPEAHRPSPRERDHRQLVRYRHDVQGEITSLKCRMRNLLANYNADHPSLFSVAGRAYSAQLQLSPADRFVLDEHWKSLDQAGARLTVADAALKEFAKSDPPPVAAARQLLKTIPGVGRITTDVFLAETADVRRFSSQKKLTAYAGLAPGRRSSDGRSRDLPIERTGSRLLRWVLVQAAWQLVRRDGRWKTIFLALAKRRGKKKAIVAVARRLQGVMRAVVLSGRPYQPGGPGAAPHTSRPAQVPNAAAAA